ncbi:MAG: hypothetical protein R2792_14880 [Saprospiraceae bacterium]
MPSKPNILVVCGRNKRRSRTAEHVFKNDSRMSIRSVGLSPQSPRQIRESDLVWADLVVVMEYRQSARIVKEYRALDLPTIHVLDIPDEYEYLDPELVELLEDGIGSLLEGG